MSAQFALGDRVQVRGGLYREKDWDDEKRVTRKRWLPYGVSGTALVIGLRTYSDGHVDRITESDGYGGAVHTHSEWFPWRHFQAYLVVFDLREKPVVVLPEDMELIQ